MQNKSNYKITLCTCSCIVAFLLTQFITGCASDYPCGEPGIGTCKSVSQNYQKSFTHYTNPDDIAISSDGLDSANTSVSAKGKPVALFKFGGYPQTPADGAPLISKPTMLRVWLTPYTDSDNIYHDQSYEYVLTDKGHWLYGANTLNLNNNIQNISLVQSSNASRVNSLGTNSSDTKVTNPNNLLQAYPAFNTLNNESMSITTIKSGVNRTSFAK